MARSQRGGSSGRRSRTYWMYSCGSWNWDWRSTCLSCGYAAPPWALESPRGKAKPEADKDGWVDQPRGRRAQRQARSAASRTASTKSQTSASAASGTPSNGGGTAIERLQATVERLEALLAGPPDGVDSCFTDVVANQLEAKRAELASAQKEAAEQKVQLQKAQDELAALDGEVEEASRALQVLEEAAREEAEERRRQRAADWAGASHVPGLLTQLDKLPESWGSSNFEVAWAAIRAQVEAVRAQLAVPPPAPESPAPWTRSAATMASSQAAACPGRRRPQWNVAKPSGTTARTASGRKCPRHARRSWSLKQRTWPLWLLALLATQLGAATEECSQGRRVPSRASAAGQRIRASSGAEEEALPQPLGARAAMPVFFPQSDGGVRPTVNGPRLMRIWGSPRQPVGALWEAEHDHRVFWDKMDRKFDKASWLRSACAAFVRVRGFASASLCLDITKPYENLRHAFLRRCGVEHGFDPWALRGMHVLHQAGAGSMYMGAEYEPLEPCAVRAGRPRAAGVGLDPFHKDGPAASAAWSRSGHAGTRQAMQKHHHAQADIVQELGRWSCRAASIWHGIAAKDCEGLLPAAERRQVRVATAEEPQAAEDTAGAGPIAKRPRLERARSTGSSSAALSARAVAFSILGHALPYACAGEGEDTQELEACSTCGAYVTLGGRSGERPRLKERCPGGKADEAGRNQRSLWPRGLHPGGRMQEGSRAARHKVKGYGIPALLSQGPVPEHAQERHLEWLGIAAEPTVDSSAAASSAGSAPAAAAELRWRTDWARPRGFAPATRAGLLGALGIAEEELAAAAILQSAPWRTAGYAAAWRAVAIRP
ncbi:unnamed protein product [Prorocentrum cordatum]|uniref:RanBP2-type domain-containing protein n=1 Tax=Prorocentrum cordatum TaxID=2364126 RepID=A0ABN9W234_9DINO|nr:unnamed protein product [Polarella glacialis]